MLTSKEEKSQELSQALIKTSKIQDIPMAKTNVKAHVIPSSHSNAAVIASSNIVGSDGSTCSRESASRSQNTLTLKKLSQMVYRMILNLLGNDHDYAGVIWRGGDKWSNVGTKLLSAIKSAQNHVLNLHLMNY